jgi:hypothetical protein
MKLTIVKAKIVYGIDDTQLGSYAHARGITLPASPVIATLSDQQFVRFKCAGRRHGQSSMKEVRDPLTNNLLFSYQRADRSASGNLERWDTGAYKTLVSRVAPWGAGGLTNRDHLLADSINQYMYSHGTNPYAVGSSGELKREGLAVTVSGHHHRKASETYGGRVHAIKASHAANPTAGSHSEMDAMLGYKQDPANRKTYGKTHSTLRIEMVGAYCYLYKMLVEKTVINADPLIDNMLMNYLISASASDDGWWRINPAGVGYSATSSQVTGSGTKWKV